MTAITLPNTIHNACRRLDNDRKNEQALNRFLKSAAFSDAVFNHKKQHPETSIEEYKAAIEALLEQYKAGQGVNSNDLIDHTVFLLDGRIAERNLSRNALRDSFLPLLKDLGIIIGNKPMTWAYLDTPSMSQKLINHAQNWYRASLEKTDAEAKLAAEIRNQKALQRLEKTILENRAVQDDIRHHLDYIKKEDSKCREIAYELGIPYSQAKEDAMKKRSKTGSATSLKNYLFMMLVGGTLITGFMMSSKPDNAAPDWSQGSAYAATAEQTETNGLSTGETIWRDRYIELYKQHGGATPEMEKEMIALSGEYMLSMETMRDIVAGISAKEVAQ